MNGQQTQTPERGGRRGFAKAKKAQKKVQALYFSGFFALGDSILFLTVTSNQPLACGSRSRRALDSRVKVRKQTTEIAGCLP
jgi:hypothetical protein